MAKSNNNVEVIIPSFQELIDRQADDKKMAASKQETLKIKKEAKLSGQIAQAHVAALEAKERFEASLLSETGNEAAALQEFESAVNTLKFYQKLYSQLFPNV